MAIEGKKQYGVWLDEENTEYVKSFLQGTRNKRGLSGLLDDHITTMARTLKAANYQPGEKLGVAKLTRIFLKGIRQEVV